MSACAPRPRPKSGCRRWRPRRAAAQTDDGLKDRTARRRFPAAGGPAASGADRRPEMRNATSGTIPARSFGVNRMIASALLALALAVQGGSARAQSAAEAATHRYVEAATPPSEAATALAGRLGGTAVAFDLVAAGEERPLVRAEAARLADGSLRLLAWRSLAPLPVLRRDIRAE